MKKITAAVFCLILAFSIFASGCAKNDVQTISTPAVPENAVYMYANILEIGNGNMVVEPIEGSVELSSADRFSVPTANMDTAVELKVGDVVEIIYDGMIEETYPAALGTVYFIQLAGEE